MVMGLDAYVNCDCFEKGKIIEPPLGMNDLFRDSEGFLDSQFLSNERERLDCDQYEAVHGELQKKYNEWEVNCCSHEYGELCTERISNWSGCADLDILFKKVGYDKIPFLYNLLPDGNGGNFPSEKAKQALHELDIFLDAVKQVEPSEYEFAVLMASRLNNLFKASLQTGNPIQWC